MVFVGWLTTVEAAPVFGMGIAVISVVSDLEIVIGKDAIEEVVTPLGMGTGTMPPPLEVAAGNCAEGESVDGTVSVGGDPLLTTLFDTPTSVPVGAA